MKVDDLKLFVKIVELGSFTAAANAHDLPRANVSRRINELEHKLNAQLFHRTTRRLSLTNKGESYYRDVLKALAILDTANQQLSGTVHNVRGRIKLGLLAEAHELLQPILFAFQDKYPDVELDLRTINNGFADMFQYGLDIAVHSGRLIDSDLVARPLIKLDRCLVASPQYLRQHGIPETLDDLAHHQCICFRWPSGGIENIWHFKDGSITMAPKLIANIVGFIKQASVNHRGISFLPTLLVHTEIQRGELVTLLEQYQPQAENSYLLYPQPKTLNHASRLLIEHLLDEVPKLSQLSQYS
ncbi:transcriptional regulator [Photobacterium aquae]|uniref:Transcriptional regulator n=1 Tax=Photobacterium aquae TaxID=1195763 RepID=A0A0J1GVU3_9GAMM|nr:LysR family transcriptional regulator [Photobacterium aquae]KLV03746.1 transcriptional regulator [Photobacterium aquae]